VNCTYFEKLFSGYIDGDLEQEARDALRFHLHGCTRCSTRVSDMERTVRALKGLPVAGLSSQFDQVLRSSLQEERTREIYRKPFWPELMENAVEWLGFARRRSVQYAFAAGFVLVVGLLGGISSYKSPVETVRVVETGLYVPAFVEPSPAMWGLAVPISVPLRPAPVMKVSPVLHTQPQTAVSPSSSPVMLTMVSVSSPQPMPRSRGILTIQTLEPKISGFAVDVSTAGSEFFTQPEETDPSVNTFDATGRRPLPSASSKKRVTRVSF